ncbi:hypothetical protein [Staphylothermus marinus]|nr:hypothetical protein [Staphylothermus marinus]
MYSVWAVLIKNRRKAFMIGLSSTIVVSIISLFVMFTINVLFGRFYFFKCDPASYGIEVLNPYTQSIADANSIYLSRLVANMLWIILFLQRYYYELESQRIPLDLLKSLV